MGGQVPRFWNWTHVASHPSSVCGCVTLGKPLSCSGPWRPHLTIAPSLRGWEGINKTLCVQGPWKVEEVLTAPTVLRAPFFQYLSLLSRLRGWDKQRTDEAVCVVGAEGSAVWEPPLGSPSTSASSDSGPGPAGEGEEAAWVGHSCGALVDSGRGCPFGVLSEHFERPPLNSPLGAFILGIGLD